MSSDHPDSPSLLDDAVIDALRDDYAATGDLDELAGLFRGFLERSEEQIGLIGAAAASGDAGAMRQAAHRLKGSCRTLGAYRAGAIAGRVEASAGAGDVAAARREVAELEAVFAQTREALMGAVAGLRDGGPGSAR